ncbi:hypothetical protein [Endozoicomonas ascidiicola]|uniref:hypothetical protein n=1 Tax=Endozoicomonas ascidiicola TaxID=1698521 RepID=UPI00082C3A59|nr:hypothetical protein [Endozoicomonas ascidiicola]
MENISIIEKLKQTAAVVQELDGMKPEQVALIAKVLEAEQSPIAGIVRSMCDAPKADISLQPTHEKTRRLRVRGAYNIVGYSSPYELSRRLKISHRDLMVKLESSGIVYQDKYGKSGTRYLLTPKGRAYGRTWIPETFSRKGYFLDDSESRETILKRMGQPVFTDKVLSIF